MQYVGGCPATDGPRELDTSPLLPTSETELDMVSINFSSSLMERHEHYSY